MICLTGICLTGAAAADEPISPAQVWLVPTWAHNDRTQANVSILNVAAASATVTCHVYTDVGVRADRASQTKTYGAGASRSNEGGSVPCAFSYAGAARGWAVVSSPTPVIVRAQTCTTAVASVCTPIEARPVDCRTPAGLEAVCRHAPPLALLLPPDAEDRLRDRPIGRP
jgi:hypothetical protein